MKAIVLVLIAASAAMAQAPAPVSAGAPSTLQPGAAKSKWTLQYFYDQDKTELSISDFAFPSAKRGVAVGTIYDLEERKGPRFVALVTSDGGGKWDQVPLREFPRSIFFLDDSQGWLVTDDGIWATQESGRSWNRIADQIKPNRKLAAAPDGGLIIRLWFLSEKHGYAVGLQKSVFETQDGGKTWVPLQDAAKPQSNPAFSVYSRIAFADARRGMILGGYFPKRPGDDLPAWMVPESAARRRLVPTLTLQLATVDAGMTWSPSTAPLFGSVSSIRLAGANGLAVFNYGGSFEWPTEVYRLDLRTGKSESAFRQKDRRVTDTILFADGATAPIPAPGATAFLAAVEPSGTLSSGPIPGKVKILTSSDLKNWSEMEVDYRAVARSITLAGPDLDHLWAATDTGMILQLSTASR